MQPRYSLRFENGERRGETIPIPGNGITVGRRPGNSVQVTDASVSGRHAEFVVEPDGLVLRDLGSTNGTKVGGERISQSRLKHGDEVLLGNVMLVVVDAQAGGAAAIGGDELELEFDAPAPARAPEPPAAPRVAVSERLQTPTQFMSPAPPPEAANAGDAVRTISAEKVARSGKRSFVGALVLVALLGGGGAAWFLLGQGASGGEEGRKLRPVEAVDGNLLAASFSFETGDGWAPEDGAPAAFATDTTSRWSGELGLGALVDANQWAIARSEAVRGSGQRVLTLRGRVRVGDAARARLGLELESSSGASARTVAWGPVIQVGGDFEEVSASLTVPAAFDSVRALVLAEAAGAGGGSVDVDDVSLVPGGEAKLAAIDEFQLVSHGEPAFAASLFKIDRTLVSDVHVRLADGGVAGRAPIAVERGENAFTLALGSGAGRTLSLRVDEPLFKGGVATTGTGGYRTHSTEFTREAVTSVIAGAGKDQVRLAFAEPVQLRGKPEGSGLRLEFELGPGSSARLQTNFIAERDEAQKLARAAREAEQGGQLGRAAEQWGKLRDEYPFDARSLEEAEVARARIAEGGLATLRTLRGEVERARFFRLVELYRKCRRDTLAAAARYEGSDIATEANSVVAEIDQDLALLEADLTKAERARLEGIAGALERSESPRLATRVREVLSRMASAATPRGDN